MRVVCNRRLHVFIVACSIFSLPLQQTLAASPLARSMGSSPPTASVVQDVALRDGGVMRGQVVDAQGVPCAHAALRLVKLGSRARVVAAATTDREGRFEFVGVPAGVYRLEGSGIAQTCRLWAPHTAPPAASDAALVVHADPAVRANLGGISPLGWTLIGVGVAAAIAIPLALEENEGS